MSSLRPARERERERGGRERGERVKTSHSAGEKNTSTDTKIERVESRVE